MLEIRSSNLAVGVCFNRSDSSCVSDICFNRTLTVSVYLLEARLVTVDDLSMTGFAGIDLNSHLPLSKR